MKRITLIFTLIILAVISAKAQQAPAPASLFIISVPGFADGTQIPVKFSQAAAGIAPGEGFSPAITWANVPAGTQSFVLHMHDLDASRNKSADDQLHWLVWNIPASSTGFTEGQPKGATLPNGSYQISASGQFYRGPGAPAAGALHHYVFELYALDVPAIEVKPSTDELETRRNVLKAVQGHVLGKAAYGGMFKRPNP
jgi:Raf kinase inhibitor-like YbhB/YbcL family protein